MIPYQPTEKQQHW